MITKKYISQALLITAIFLFGFSLFSVPVKTHVYSMQYIVANAVVGLSASIPPNPSNTLAMQLAEKEERLAEREERLAELEAAAHRSSDESLLALYALGISIMLFALVGLNFYLDWRRSRRRESDIGNNGLLVNLKK